MTARRSDPHRTSRASRQRGYTLLEVIVAFALLAVALTLLIGILGNAARQVRGADDAGRAALYAQTLIDQIGIGEPLVAGEHDGEFEQGRYRWQLRIAPWRDATIAAQQQAATTVAPRLFEITLAMEWGDAGPGQRLQLRSLRTTAAGSEAVLP